MDLSMAGNTTALEVLMKMKEQKVKKYCNNRDEVLFWCGYQIHEATEKAKLYKMNRRLS